MLTFFKIIIDNTKVFGIDKANFIYFFNDGIGSIPVSFWANVIDINGLDIRFYNDESKSVELKREIDHFNSSLHEVRAWIQIPLLRGDISGIDTEIFCEVGGATNPNSTEVWSDLGGQAIQHFSDDYVDSVVPSNIVSPGGIGSPSFVDSPTGKGVEFDFGQFAEYTTNIVPNAEDHLVFSTWIKVIDPPPYPGTFSAHIFCRDAACITTSRQKAMFTFGINSHPAYGGLNTFIYRMNLTTTCTIGSRQDTYFSSSGLPIGSWVHIAIIAINNEDISRIVSFFLNGVSVPFGTELVDPGLQPDPQQKTTIGAAYAPLNGDPLAYHYFYDGAVSELRLFNLADAFIFDADWIKTDYEQMNVPASFSLMIEAFGDPIPFNIIFKTTLDGIVDKPASSIDPWITFSLGWFEGIAAVSDIITDHISRAQNLLIEQFESSENLKTLLGIYVKQIQKLEFNVNNILQSRNLAVASGAQLDIIGERVGEPRNFKNDVDYKDAINFKIFLNNSSGEPEVLIAALKRFTNATRVSYYEPYPATALLVFQSPFLPPSNLQEKMEQIAPTGVQILLGFVNNDAPVFGFSGEGGFPDAPNTEGFNEINNDVGGQFIELLT